MRRKSSNPALGCDDFTAGVFLARGAAPEGAEVPRRLRRHSPRIGLDSHLEIISGSPPSPEPIRRNGSNRQMLHAGLSGATDPYVLSGQRHLLPLLTAPRLQPTCQVGNGATNSRSFGGGVERSKV